ncbi:phage tail protein [Erwinia tracheiphila]|uniref:Phage tail protein n=1 Tax=Erwinia tracheiphila TaxID=65700 RepID=A0A345CVI3_9GAMM|nr:phage tail protein [Erwinia tracheiphila]AXF77450.1 phage tail protein [Erwinia tracheiphila]UIA83853.1 phage tail protein [Erwinia tracheiphila]UIA92435.1 phage tail protein [Erwinia tracheiphila]
MATKYFALLTNIGAAKLANATALGVQVEITQMAVGDGNGALPTPNPAQTALLNELRRGPLNALSVDPDNISQLIAEQVIPESAGGWWIREIGLFDSSGDLIAIANCAETYKPQLQEGSGRVQVIRMILIVSSTDAVTLKIDPSVVLATRKYADDAVIEVKAYVDQQLAAHIAVVDPHTQYLLESDIDKYIPVGFPLPWPTATAPAGWLKCNGAAFDKAKYPALAVAYPSGSLPDLRGEFIRGADDGRGMDAGRSVLSAQNDAMGVSYASNGLTVKNILVLTNRTGSGADAIDGLAAGDAFADGGQTSSARLSVRSANETRPRNIAFNYIVRAA